MKDVSKLSIAMDIIENQIAEYMINTRNGKSEPNEKIYKNLLDKKDKIYNGNIDEINNIIKENMKEKK